MQQPVVPSEPIKPLALARRLAPAIVLTLLMGAFFWFDLDRMISFDILKAHRSEMMAFVERHPVLAPLIFVGTYALVVACSLPIATVLTVTGGFLFGPWLGCAIVVSGATVGAVIVFLAARTALGDFLQKRAGPTLRRMEEGFRENALNYMLFLRLVPVFPFWIVNLAPAFLGVPLRIFALGTVIGIIPASFVFVYVGQGLGSIFERGDAFSLAGILTPDILLAFALLACLALVPVAIKRLKRRKAQS